MPPDRRPSKNAFNIDVLSPQALDGPRGVDNALRAIEAVCRRGGPEVAQMLIVLIAGRSYLLEHIVSGAFCVSIPPCASRALIILPSSDGRGSVRKASGVGSGGVSHSYNVKRDGHDRRAPPPEVLVFVDVCQVSIHRGRSSQPPCIPEEGRTLFRYRESPRREWFDEGNQIPCWPGEGKSGPRC